MHFVVYDKTGQILRSGTCSRQSFSLQANDGEFVMEAYGRVDDSMYKVVEGKIQAKTAVEIEDSKSTSVGDANLPPEITQSEWDDLNKRLSAIETALAELKASAAKNQAAG